VKRVQQFFGRGKVSGEAMASKAYVGIEMVVPPIVECLSSGLGIERILITQDADALHVWSIVSNLPEHAMFRIYDHEAGLVKRFAPLPIDFHVIDRRGASADDLIPGAQAVFGN
jgi:hypothetical protein